MELTLPLVLMTHDRRLVEAWVPTMPELRAVGPSLAEIRDERDSRTQRFVLAIISLGTGIPLTAIGANLVDPPLLGVSVTWAGIVGVNAVFALRDRTRRRP